MRTRTLGLFLLLSVLWGSAFVAIKAGLDYFPPVLFAAIRYDVAALVMLAYAWHVTEHAIPRSRSEWKLVLVSGVTVIAGYHAFLFVGEQTTTSATAAVIVSLSPVLTTGFARILLPDERLSVVGVIGLLLGLLGVAVLADLDPSTLFRDDLIGEALVLGAAASFALGSVLADRSTAELPIETTEAWAMASGALALHATSAGLGESLRSITWTPEAVWSLAYLSLGASALGFLIYFDLLDRLGPIEINLVSYVAPVVAAVVGWVWLEEVVDGATAGGFLLVVVGFVLVKRTAIRQELLATSGS